MIRVLKDVAFAMLLGSLAALATACVQVAHAQEPGAVVAGLDLEGLLVGLVLPYVAHALSVASVMGVLRWFVPALRKRPGEKKLAPEQVRIVQAICVGLAILSTLGGKIPPLGGADAGIPGLVGAGALVALLAMALRDGLRAALKRRAKGA